jgi:HPt (histidine-containing phosphotransfer) domain-containing protein
VAHHPIVVDHQDFRHSAVPLNELRVRSAKTVFGIFFAPQPRAHTRPFSHMEPFMPIDETQALQLLGGDRDLLKQLATIFKEDASVLVREYETAMTHGDLVSAQRAVHSLKGLVATFYADDAVTSLAAIETSLSDKEVEDYHKTKQVLDGIVSAVVRQLVEKQLLIDEQAV